MLHSGLAVGGASMVKPAALARKWSCSGRPHNLRRWMRHNRCVHEQGIKFYEPEVVGDTPETVELVGVRNLVAAAAEHLGYEAGTTIFSTDGSVRSPQPTVFCLLPPDRRDR